MLIAGGAFLGWAYFSKWGPFEQPERDLIELIAETQTERFFEIRYEVTESAGYIQAIAQNHCQQLAFHGGNKRCIIFVVNSSAQPSTGNFAAVAANLLRIWDSGDLVAIFYQDPADITPRHFGDIFVADCNVFLETELSDLAVCMGMADGDYVSEDLRTLLTVRAAEVSNQVSAVAEPVSQVAIITFPTTPDQVSAGGLRHQLAVGQQGELSYNYGQITVAVLAELIASNRDDQHIETLITPDAEAPFDQVVQTIAQFNAAGDAEFTLMGNENFRTIFGQGLPGLDADSLRNASRSRQIPITISGQSRPGAQCSATLAGVPVDGAALYDASYTILETAVLRLGGFEAALQRPDDLPRPVITATADTPWQCIGGALFNLQAAGIFTVQLVVAD